MPVYACSVSMEHKSDEGIECMARRHQCPVEVAREIITEYTAASERAYAAFADWHENHRKEGESWRDAPADLPKSPSYPAMFQARGYGKQVSCHPCLGQEARIA